MFSSVRYWFINRFKKILNSISFYPALIGLVFLILAILMLGFDFSIQGKNLKSQLSWLNIKDASTARSIISAIAAGIISLAVFSFSMVMIVLNQAASQMSNRVLDKLIGNRFQQIILGVYIGTIVYAFFLLSTIRDIDSGLYIPSLSIYFLILLTIVDIFLFIYFLHYITQSVKYEVIIRRIFDTTFNALKQSCQAEVAETVDIKIEDAMFLYANKAGIYEGFDAKLFTKVCSENDIIVEFLLTPGTSVLQGIPLVKVSKEIDAEELEYLSSGIFINDSESIEANYLYGFRQLTEIAMKALSPGINDPGTAILAIRSLFQLYAYRLKHYPISIITNQGGKACILLNPLTFDSLIAETLLPIWNYGCNDRMIQQELFLLINQLASFGKQSTSLKVLLADIVAQQHKQLL